MKKRNTQTPYTGKVVTLLRFKSITVVTTFAVTETDSTTKVTEANKLKSKTYQSFGQLEKA